MYESLLLEATTLFQLRHNYCAESQWFFLKWTDPGLFFDYFLSFQQTIQFLQQINVKIFSSSIQRQDLNPRPFKHEPSPITTRPGLPPQAPMLLNYPTNWVTFLKLWKQFFVAAAWIKLSIYDDGRTMLGTISGTQKKLLGLGSSCDVVGRVWSLPTTEIRNLYLFIRKFIYIQLV